MKKTLFAILTAVFLLSVHSCAGRSLKEGENSGRSNVQAVITDDIRRMIGILERINSNTPSSFTCSIEVIGNIGKKKFKSLGNVKFDRKTGRFNITFLDYIFKSPLTDLFQDGDRISIYFPADKKLVLDDRKTIDIRNYINLNLDYYLLYDLFRGSIPVLKDYRVRKGLSSADRKTSYLIIENDEYYETLSFQGNTPDKLLIIHRNSKEKIELYLRGFSQKGKSRYFKKIRIVADQNDLRLDFTFRGTRINVPVKVRTIESIKVPRGVKVIRL